MNFDEKLRQALAAWDPEATYLVGVSGGCDSVMLLHGLVRLGWKNLVVCHLNHGLRGEESAADAAFVAQTALQLGLPSVVQAAAVDQLARASGRSVEAAGREARHRFFLRCQADHQAAAVFLAHHQDDLVETILLHLFRGTGLRGLAGILPDATVLVDGDAAKPLRLLRPLLTVSRQQLEQAAAIDGIPFRHDSTNDSLEITRNRLRNQLLPLACEILNRDVREPMAKLARILAEDEALLDSLVPDAAGAELSVVTLLQSHPAIRRRLILRWLQGQAVPNITLDVVLAVENLVLQERPAKTNLPAGLHVRRTAGKLWIERP